MIKLTSKPDHFDYLTLAGRVLGMTDDEIEAKFNEDSSDYIEDRLWEKLDVDIASFVSIVDALAKFTNPWQSPFTNSMFVGFVDHDHGIALAKYDVEVQ